MNVFSQPGKPMISVTHLLHFDPVGRKLLAQVPVGKCSLRISTPPVYASCVGGLVELNL